MFEEKLFRKVVSKEGKDETVKKKKKKKKKKK